MTFSNRILFAFALSLAAGAAHAGLFDLKYTNVDSGMSAALRLTTTSLTGGTSLITGITGMRNGLAVTYFQQGGPSVFTSDDGRYFLDNVLYNPASPDFVDYYSFEFKTSDGQDFNFYVNNGQYSEITSYDGFHDHAISNVSLTAVPGPAAFAPFVVGALGAARRRRRA